MRNLVFVLLAVVAMFVACSDDNEANDRGVGIACVTTDDCPNFEAALDDEVTEPAILLECLTEFKGGYCGLKDCQDHADCPEGSLCVVGDTANYCFLRCDDKPDCNKYRALDEEANCVGNAEMIDGSNGFKVCVPPSA